MNRDKTVDILRGIAIVLMVLSNLASEILVPGQSFLFRFLCSIPAPLFILLSGMMCARPEVIEKKPLGELAKRGLKLIGLGALIDVGIWNIVPFINFDVLYLLGIAAIITPFIALLPLHLGLLVGVIIIISAGLFKYNPNGVIGDVPFSHLGSLRLNDLMNNVLVSGWFSILPWIGISFIGVSFQKTLAKGFSAKKLFILSVFLLTMGIIYKASWVNITGRLDDIEYFYPLTLSFLATVMGILGFLYLGIKKTMDWNIYKPLELLGKNPLKIYVGHLIIARILGIYFEKAFTLPHFLVVYSTIVFGIYVILQLIQKEVRINNKFAT